MDMNFIPEIGLNMLRIKELEVTPKKGYKHEDNQRWMYDKELKSTLMQKAKKHRKQPEA
jgi:hypothetical protein